MNRLSTWPLERTLQIIGGRWKLYIICHLVDGPKRLSALERGIPGIAQKVLIQQLREMEEHGLVSRQVFAEVPARVEYRVTALGLSLKPIIAGLQDWGIHQGQATGEGDKLVVCAQSGRRALGDVQMQPFDA
ncbi:MAG: transcriptional regulator [Devosia sp.]|uniref:winged helix-turn-helix transcriptional regulator n=1 Tax=Devosia sp. TaxID=1871048 RepID=UPI00262F0DF4|nr:helix-turn-helix domain-containing protein [Devosia sp.]MDB5585239.1 transcriptional regulator [Devosia sp.]